MPLLFCSCPGPAARIASTSLFAARTGSIWTACRRDSRRQHGAAKVGRGWQLHRSAAASSSASIAHGEHVADTALLPLLPPARDVACLHTALGALQYWALLSCRAPVLQGAWSGTSRWMPPGAQPARTAGRSCWWPCTAATRWGGTSSRATGRRTCRPALAGEVRLELPHLYRGRHGSAAAQLACLHAGKRAKRVVAVVPADRCSSVSTWQTCQAAGTPC